MEKKDINILFSFLSKEENVINILKQLHPEAESIYKNFADNNPIDYYQIFLNDEYKEKFVDILEKELNLWKYKKL